jgi:hypothetical protein
MPINASWRASNVAVRDAVQAGYVCLLAQPDEAFLRGARHQPTVATEDLSAIKAARVP